MMNELAEPQPDPARVNSPNLSVYQRGRSFDHQRSVAEEIDLDEDECPNARELRRTLLKRCNAPDE
jgi:hypothetical protein